MPSKKKWYVEALTAHTNEVIARELPPENAHKDVLCQDGVRRDFWECSYRFVSRLIKNKATANLEFKVFYRAYRSAPVKLWPFVRKKRLTLDKAVERGLVRRAA